MNTFYKKGQVEALRKLGFIQLIDTEDLPEFMQDVKRKQLYAMYAMNAAGGRPAGGLIRRPETYDPRQPGEK